MRSRGFAAFAVVAACTLAPAILAGCVADASGPHFAAAAPGAPSAAAETGWTAGKWWSYRATFESNFTVDLTLVVFEENDGAFVLGSNLTAGFFGLPFNGTVTRPHLNPVIAGEEWQLFDFPLTPGKTWQYPFLGYDLTATATPTHLDVPGSDAHAGFQLAAGAYGRDVVVYTYSPAVEWFTELVIYEPTDGHEVVRVELTDFGSDYEDDYFITVPLHAFTAEYPTVPERVTFGTQSGYLRLDASVALTGRAGDFRYSLHDPDGRGVMGGEVRPSGVLLDTRSLTPARGEWSVRHLGIGDGKLRVEVTGVRAAREGRMADPATLTTDVLQGLTVDVPTIRLGAFDAAAGSGTPNGAAYAAANALAGNAALPTR